MVERLNEREASERGRAKGSVDERPVHVCAITCCFYLLTNTENDSSNSDGKSEEGVYSVPSYIGGQWWACVQPGFIYLSIYLFISFLKDKDNLGFSLFQKSFPACSVCIIFLDQIYVSDEWT